MFRQDFGALVWLIFQKQKFGQESETDFFYQLWTWLKRSYFGDSTQPLSLRQCLLEMARYSGVSNYHEERDCLVL